MENKGLIIGILIVLVIYLLYLYWSFRKLVGESFRRGDLELEQLKKEIENKCPFKLEK